MQAAFGAQGVGYTVFGADSPDARDGASIPSSARDLRRPAIQTLAFTIEQELVGARVQHAPRRYAFGANAGQLPEGADPEQWLTDLPTFDQLQRTDAWTGIVDVLYERDGPVESTYEAVLGADPGRDSACLAWC